MKLLVLSILLAFASSANVANKRSVLYPSLLPVGGPFIANDVGPYGLWVQFEPIPPLTAVVDFKNYGDTPEVTGKLNLIQFPGGPVVYSGNVTGLTEGAHGFHVHEFGDLSGGCDSLGAHFNPTFSHHGGPADPYRHIGDLGNIQADSAGLAKISDSDPLISLHGPNSIVGRGIVIHANKDDLGRGGDKESLKTGNSGPRVACGIIVWAKPSLPEPPKETPKPEEGGSDAEVVEP